MAVIAQFQKLEWFFRAYPQLSEIKAYITQALDPRSDIHSRIINILIPHNQYRIEISHELGRGVRAIEQGYFLKAPQEAFFETHRAYLDFQLVVSGYEYMYIGDKDTFCIKAPYDEAKDLIVYDNALPHNLASNKECDSTPPRTQIILGSGDLAIFFPDDVHAGGLELTPSKELHSQPIKKSVLKVPVSLLWL